MAMAETMLTLRRSSSVSNMYPKTLVELLLLRKKQVLSYSISVKQLEICAKLKYEGLPFSVTH